jgi:hypothetical protein
MNSLQLACLGLNFSCPLRYFKDLWSESITNSFEKGNVVMSPNIAQEHRVLYHKWSNSKLDHLAFHYCKQLGVLLV